ncbi:MAG: hypothetical protein LBJ89_02555, partial [Holosporales bacterium]|nr:hypothetical protein [Holosporales bacterium]
MGETYAQFERQRAINAMFGICAIGVNLSDRLCITILWVKVSSFHPFLLNIQSDAHYHHLDS